MGRHATDTGGGDFKQAPAGSHIARCIKLVDIGTHHGEYQGTPTVRNQFICQWELPNETMEIDGESKPLIVSKFYTNSLSEKANLRRDLESWRARPFTTEELAKFDLMKILGAPAMLSIVHNEKGKAKIVGVSSVPKGVSVPEQVNPSSAFWIDEWNDSAFHALSEGLQKMIVDSDEYKAAFTPPGQRAAQQEAAKGVDPLDDDIPF
jgi:hypothetical protein